LPSTDWNVFLISAILCEISLTVSSIVSDYFVINSPKG
jgi:hypothetical protein